MSSTTANVFAAPADALGRQWTGYFEGFYLCNPLKPATSIIPTDNSDEVLAFNRGTIPDPTVYVIPLPSNPLTVSSTTSASSIAVMKALRQDADTDLFRLRLFGFTGWDPLGKPATPAENAKANKAVIASLLAEPLVEKVWRAVGFTVPPAPSASHKNDIGQRVVDWQLEHGFLVGCSGDDDQCLQRVLKIAGRYGQGAIFQYNYHEESSRLFRKTVPVLVPCDDETVEVLLSKTSPA